ncbi:MAG: hypothetical protein MJZ57_04280 [Bacteroidales bacterium]|nr:hypothetical protein [Bacteroidales bacterium]
MLFVVGLMISSAAFSQSCLDDVWQCLRNNQAPKAKKFLESCMASNPDNAQVWLMKGNVYYQLAKTDQAKMEADPNFVPRYPSAAWEANEAFLKAITLDKEVQPKTGMMGANLGQRACAPLIFTMGVNAAKAGKNEDAVKFFTAAAHNYELSKEAAEIANASASYLQAAIAYKSLKDIENEKVMLNKSIKLGSKMPACYVELYYIYRDEFDTLNCAKVLEQAKTNLPEDAQKALADAQMNYLDFVGNTEELIALCEKVVAADPSNYEMIGIAVTYLNNSKAFAQAEQILNAALAKEPNNFDLNSQMGYRFYQEMISYDDQLQALKDQKAWNDVVAMQKEGTEWSIGRKAAMQNAHDWCEKAYQIYSDNLDNNKRLRQLKLLLGKEIPQELNDKVNARMH